MLHEDDRIVTADRRLEQALRVARSGRRHHTQTGDVGKERVIAAGGVRRCRRADADAAARHDWHLEPAVAHVLDPGRLVDDLAQGIQGEVEEHVVDDWTRAAHRGAGTQAGEAALGNRRVAQPLGSKAFVQSNGRGEIAAALANAFAHHEHHRIALHLLGKPLGGGVRSGGQARRVGPSPARARRTASPATAWTCNTSFPSTAGDGMPYAMPRALSSGLPATVTNGTSVAYWLFSHTNTTGSFQMAAMLSPSWNAPLLLAPSPKKATLTRSDFARRDA